MHRTLSTILISASALAGLLLSDAQAEERRPAPRRDEARSQSDRDDVRRDNDRDDDDDDDRNEQRRPMPPFGAGRRPPFAGGARPQFDPERMKEFQERMEKFRQSVESKHESDRCPECEKLAAKHHEHRCPVCDDRGHERHDHRCPECERHAAEHHQQHMANRGSGDQHARHHGMPGPRGFDRHAGPSRPQGPPPGNDEVLRKLDRLIDAVEALTKAVKDD